MLIVIAVPAGGSAAWTISAAINPKVCFAEPTNRRKRHIVMPRPVEWPDFYQAANETRGGIVLNEKRVTVKLQAQGIVDKKSGEVENYSKEIAIRYTKLSVSAEILAGRADRRPF